MSGHDANPIFLIKKIKVRRPEHSLIPHPPRFNNISYLPKPPPPPYPPPPSKWTSYVYHPLLIRSFQYSMIITKGRFSPGRVKEGLRLNFYCELKHLLISLFLSPFISPYLPPKISKSFEIYLSEISSCSVTLKKTDETVLMVCKITNIFDEIFKIYT